jgi:hypothetical protein
MQAGMQPCVRATATAQCSADGTAGIIAGGHRDSIIRWARAVLSCSATTGAAGEIGAGDTHGGDRRGQYGCRTQHAAPATVLCLLRPPASWKFYWPAGFLYL